MIIGKTMKSVQLLTLNFKENGSDRKLKLAGKYSGARFKITVHKYLFFLPHFSSESLFS